MLIPGPESVQLPSALGALEVNVTLVGTPVCTRSGVTVSETGPAVQAPAVTVTVTGRDVAPPHVTWYVVVTAGETLIEPFGAPPVTKPEPVHEGAFVEFHVSVAELPSGMLVGVALSVAVAPGGAAQSFVPETTAVLQSLAVTVQVSPLQMFAAESQ